MALENEHWDSLFIGLKLDLYHIWHAQARQELAALYGVDEEAVLVERAPLPRIYWPTDRPARLRGAPPGQG